jgi:hypothetical protein
MTVNDSVRSAISPLLAEAKKRRIDINAQILIASKDLSGNYYTSMNWQLFANLLADQLEMPRPEITNSEGPL